MPSFPGFLAFSEGFHRVGPFVGGETVVHPWEWDAAKAGWDTIVSRPGAGTGTRWLNNGDFPPHWNRLPAAED